MYIENLCLAPPCKALSNLLIMKARTLTDCICYALFFLFVYAAANKLMAFDFYLYDLRRSPFLSGYALLVSVLVPGAELAVAVLVLFGKTRVYVLAGAVVLMLLFTGYVVLILTGTESRPCSCGGIIKNLSWDKHLFFNVFFLLLSCWGLYLQYFQHRRTIQLTQP